MRKHFADHRLLISFFGLLAWGAPLAAAQAEPVDALVQQIIQLRGDVGDLDNRLQQLKEEHKNRMASLAREQGELAAAKERQQLRLKKLRHDMEQQRASLMDASADSKELEPIIRQVLSDLRLYVNESLPFKRGERLAALDEMEVQLEGGSVTAPRLINNLWALLADEMSLAEGVGLYRQSIAVDGQDKLVDVARVGMMQLYFRTDDERYGYAARNGDNWQYFYADAADGGRIGVLIGSLRKQVRSGYFELPNPVTAQSQPSAE